MPDPKPKPKTARKGSKLENIKIRLNADIQAVTERMEKEVVQARDWPPPEMIPRAILQGIQAIGARAVKMVTALEKAEDQLVAKEKELRKLRRQAGDADASEVAHLRMENKLLKEHIEKGGASAEEAKILKDEKVDLQLKLDNLEAELNRLLIEASDAEELREENQMLHREVEELRREGEELRGAAEAAPEKTAKSKSGRVLTSIWDMAEVEKGPSDDPPQVAALKRNVKKLTEDLERTTKKITSLKGQNENLSSKVMELAEAAALRAESAMEEINNLREERNLLEKELEQNRNRVETLEGRSAGEVEELEKETERLRFRVAELEDAQETMFENMRSIDEVVADAEEGRARYQFILDDLKEGGPDREGRLKKAVVDLISRCEALEKSETAQQKRIEELGKSGGTSDSTGDLENIITELQTRIGELEDELDEKEDELARFEKEAEV